MKKGSEAHPVSEEDGRNWMLEFQAGDDSAFDRLVLHFEGPVRHFLYRYLRDRNRAEDLTQEAFIRVFRSRGRYVPSAQFKTWLFTIASRLALNEIRGIRRRRRVFTEFSDVDEDTGTAPWQRSPDHREIPPAAKLEHKELETVVGDLIEQLPANQKAALLLSRAEDLSYSEISKALGLSVMAVKSLLMRARETLRGRLQGYLTCGELDPKLLSPRRKH